VNTKEVQEALKRLGWPIQADGSFGERTFRAVKNFQRGFAFWDLIADGAAGEKTQRALRYSVAHGGLSSPHFAFREFKSPGNGWIKVDRELARGLEEYRDEVGGPVIITSGEVKRLRRFSGIGVVKSSEKIIHMDVRHRGPNTSGGTVGNPTVWFE
jgi:peptidoglycan hydrolase-like protein with peptidoglycan-binding domain